MEDTIDIVLETDEGVVSLCVDCNAAVEPTIRETLSGWRLRILLGGEAIDAEQSFADNGIEDGSHLHVRLQSMPTVEELIQVTAITCDSYPLVCTRATQLK